MKSTKIIFLAIAQIAIIALLAGLMHYGISWLLDNLLIRMFNWFNALGLVKKWVCLLLGGIALVALVIKSTVLLSKLIGMWFNRLFAFNAYVRIISIIGMIILTISDWVVIWNLPNRYDFWIVFQLIFLSVFVATLYAALVPEESYVGYLED